MNFKHSSCFDPYLLDLLTLYLLYCFYVFIHRHGIHFCSMLFVHFFTPSTCASTCSVEPSCSAKISLFPVTLVTRLRFQCFLLKTWLSRFFSFIILYYSFGPTDLSLTNFTFFMYSNKPYIFLLHVASYFLHSL